MPSPTRKAPSVTKTLLSLTLSDPSNRSCADCCSALVDPSDVHASLCPSLETVQRSEQRLKVSVALHDFRHTHRAFAPHDVKATQAVDPGKSVNQRLGGHGIFICSRCAEAHRKLGQNVTKVIPVQESSQWTQSEAELMTNSGGNARCKIVYEAYVPETWHKRRPTASSSLEDRVIFCKAKYEALAFVMPPLGPLSKTAWESILERNHMAKQYMSPGLKNIHSLVPAATSEASVQDFSRTKGGVMPHRLIDFFCVVSNSSQLHPNESSKDLSHLSSPEEINLWPQVTDCYPPQTSYSDMIFPEHLPTFVLPNGCSPKSTQPAPTFFTFVLTLGDGDRIYGGGLQIYDEHMESEHLKSLILTSGYEGDLPPFLDESDVVFLPKCLVLLSHYPFFDLFRESLLELYRITLVQAPLPIERYVANLVSEIPLPPRGKVRVEFGFTSSRLICIERPPPNQLPLANFSYRPMFACLSAGNIMVVLGCLMEECKVALMSSHCSILTPVAEALLSSIFPFVWQGLYIPVMPYSLVELLDAPVPFLIGLDSRYFQETPPSRRPKNVVFVDLDRDVVHLGVDDLTDANRRIPPLPSRDAHKLKNSLDASGDLVYLLPRNGIKGCIMEGHEELLLITNSERPKYAQMHSVNIDEGSISRESVLDRTKKAYDEHELLEAVPGFRDGQLRLQDGESDILSGDASKKRSMRRVPRFKRNTRTQMLVESMEASGQSHLLDMNDPAGFSPTALRRAFLRFFVATFSNYGKFIKVGRDSDLFDDLGFLQDLGEDPEATSFVGRVLKTQMFQRFLEERLEDPDTPEIRFFDESIVEKYNRSRVSQMQKGGKLPTPFLDDESGKITRTYTPPPPNSRGLPESNDTFQYTLFPKLDRTLIGSVRTPPVWKESDSYSRRMRSTGNSKLLTTEQDILKRVIFAWTRSRAKPANDLETALSSLKILKWRKLLLPKGSREPNAKLPDSSLHLSLSSPSLASGESDRELTILSKADTIVMNARRKQAILLDEVVVLQAVWRTHAARWRYTQLRKATMLVQRRFRGIDFSAQGPNTIHSQSMALKHNILCIQRYVRGYIARQGIIRSKLAAIQIQRRVRGCAVRRRQVKLKAGVVLIQRSIRGWRDRITFYAVKRLVCKIQGRVRGFVVRAWIFRIFQAKMTLYRDEIISLWQVCHVPLSFRTKFWPALTCSVTFIKINVVESELKRLWKVIGISVNEQTSCGDDDIVKIATTIGLDSYVYRRCQELRLSIRDVELQLCKAKQKVVACAFGYEEAERLQVHERLMSKPYEMMTRRMYVEFAIPPSAKMKKVALAKVLWTEHRFAELSRSTMLTLFPELDDSLQIAFQPASSKSKRRFPSAAKSPAFPFSKASWSDMSLEGLIAKHSKEVTHLYITEVPSIMAKLARQRNDAVGLEYIGAERRTVQRYLFGR